MNYLKIIVCALLAILFAIPGIAFATTTVLPIFGGGTGTSTTPSYGQVLLGQSNGTYSLVATSSLGISGGGGGGISWPWSAYTNYGTTTIATTTPYQAFEGLFASSTSHFVRADFQQSTSTSFYVPATANDLWLGDTAGQAKAYGGASACSANNFVTTISAAGGTTCGTASISGVNLGSNLSSLAPDGSTITGTSYNGSGAVSNWSVNTAHAFTWSALHVFSGNASSTQVSAYTAYFGGTSTSTITSAGLVGIASSTPNPAEGMTIATTTVISGAGIANSIASSTTDNSTETVNWDKGNTVRYILNQSTNFAINATSSNPRDGGKYVLKLCQDPTGSRTATFITPGQLRWANGTTSIGSTANTCSMIGMIYDANEGVYDVVASSTGLQIN